MVDPVHVRRDQDPAQHPVEPRRQAQIAVVEHRGAVEHDLEDDDGHGRRADDDHRRELQQDRQDDLDGMEPGPGGDVEIEIGMMHAMQPPQRRHGVEHDMLQIDDEIEDDDRDRDLQPERQRDQVEDPPAAIRGQGGQGDGKQGNEEPHRQCVEEGDADIAVPAQPARPRQGPARRRQLPQGDEGEDAEEGTEPDRRFVRADQLRHARSRRHVSPPRPDPGAQRAAAWAPVSW